MILGKELMLISKSLIFSIGICSYIAVGVFSYYKGYSTADSEYKATLNQLQTSNLKAILNQERLYKEKENGIIQDYQDKIQLLKKEYDKVLIAGNTLSNTFVPDCLQHTNTSSTRVSKETRDKPSVKCYTETDLLRKVKESMAIGNECDQLAIRYNSLLEWCKQ